MSRTRNLTARSDSLRPRPDAPALRVVARAGVAVALFALALCGCRHELDDAELELSLVRSALSQEQDNLARLSADVVETERLSALAHGTLTAALADVEANCAAKALHVLRLEVRQGHRWSLNPMKHIKDALNASEFEIAVDADYFAAVSVGQELTNEFRVGSAVLRGSISSMTVKVTGKRVELRGAK